MSIVLSFDELLTYSNKERGKWDTWFRAQSESVWQLRVHPHDRFVSAWSLLDHIFVVEQRHLQRLRGEYPLPETTGIVEGRWENLREWSVTVRQNLTNLAAATTEEQSRVPLIVQLPNGWVTVSTRKILFHVLLHEARHWAQLALVFRQAGLSPPGDHDLIFSDALG